MNEHNVSEKKKISPLEKLAKEKLWVFKHLTDAI